MLIWVGLGLATAYAVFVALRLGLPQRVALALRPISLEEIPDRAAAKYGDRVLFTSDTPCAWEVPALRRGWPGRADWSASRLRSTIGYLAAMFQDRLGVQRGDRVAILKENHFDIHIFVASVVRAGGIACPMNGRFAADHVGPYLANIGASVLLSDAATLGRVLEQQGDFGPVSRIVVAEKRTPGDSTSADVESRLASRHSDIEIVWLEEALADVNAERPPVRRATDEPLYLVHSSGTTGFPKAVILRNGPQSHAVRGWLCFVHLSRRDKGYLAVPNNHQAVILTFNSALLLGLPVHWTSAYDRHGFDPDRVLRELAEGHFTGFFGFPIAYTQLKEARLGKYDLGAMKVWASTADASHEAVVRRFVAVGGAFRSLGVPIAGSAYLDAQGSSEVGTPSVIRFVTRFTRNFDRRIGRPGSTPFGPRIQVTALDGRRARRGEVGRLEVKGKTVFNGYWNNSAMTCGAFRNGWFFTGDVARRGTDGHIIQLDREVDVIHTGLGDVYSLPIEEKIHKHAAIFDACVYGERQEDGTQRPAVAIALREGIAIPSERLRQDLNALLEPEERLHRLDILRWDEFPIGITGKTLKRVFRERTERLHGKGAHWWGVQGSNLRHPACKTGALPLS